MVEREKRNSKPNSQSTRKKVKKAKRMLVWEGLLKMKTWKWIFPHGVEFWKLIFTWAAVGLCRTGGLQVQSQESPEVLQAFPRTGSSLPLPMTSSPFRSQRASKASGFPGLARGLAFDETKGVLFKALAKCIKLWATFVLPGRASWHEELSKKALY